MNTKLTLRLDDDLIRTAKRHAESTGRSVSRLVADFFALVGSDVAAPEGELTPRVRGLLGALAGSTVTEDDYRRHLEERQP